MQPAVYLFFNGQCFEAMTFYVETLGGEVLSVFRNADAEDPDDRMPGGPDTVMNMAARFDSVVVMASDNSGDMYETPAGFRLQLEMTSLEEFERIHAELAQDAIDVAMPPGETFWAERFTMFTDRFGTPWMLNFEGNRAR